MLTVGRVGLDATVRLREVQRSASGRGDVVRLTGNFRGASLAETKVLRQEISALAAMRHTVIPVTYSVDSDLDGYYRLLTARVDAAASQGSLQDRGYLPYDLRLERVGSEADVAMQSVITGAVRSNVQGVDLAESQPWHALPAGYVAYDPPSTPSYVVRSTADGQSAKVWYDIDVTVDPTWGIAPSAFYRAAAEIKVGGYVRAGLSCPNTPADWELSNGVVKIAPNGSNAGQLDVSTWTGSAWSSAKTWEIRWSGTAVNGWKSVSILRNDPEACAVRLVYMRDPNAGRMTADLLLRRGSRFVEVTLAFHVASTLEIRRATAEAGSTVTPPGATSAVAVQASADDADGQRYIAGSGESVTFDTTQGGLSRASTKTLTAFVGTVRDAATAGNSADDLCLQYLGYVAERVVPVRR